jgi:hypothetical protein
MRTKEYQIGLSTFERIRAAFPGLVMNLDLAPTAPVDLAMDIPAQEGLSFKIWLDLQGDDLTLSASRFSYEWFPCTKQKTVDGYVDAVSGLISGRFRILEHWRGRRTVKAQLQSPDDGKWASIATSANISALIPWPPKKLRIVQNNSTLPS